MDSSSKDNIFVDTNVLIGAWTDMQTDKNCLQYLFSLTGKRLFISALTVAQLVSVFQKMKTNMEIKKIVDHLLLKFTVISFTDKDIRNSIELKGSDIEDNIQYVISKKFHCSYFITNNKKDYNSFVDIEVLLPHKVRLIDRN